MADMDTWAMPMMMMLIMPLMFVGVFIARYDAYVGIAWIFGTDFAMVPIMRFARKIATWRAGLVHHQKAWFVQRGDEKKFVGQQIFKWREHPETLKARIRNFRCPDGHFEPLVYITPVRLPRLFNRVRHPRYNQGGALPGIVEVHPLPFDLQFREDLNTTSHAGYTVKVSTVSWAVLDEIQPRLIRDLLGQSRHNLFPGIDKELLHVPWYFVPLSSGTGVNTQKEQPKLAMQVGPKGAMTFPCAEVLGDGTVCGKPLGKPDAEGWANCPEGHGFYMNGAKR